MDPGIENDEGTSYFNIDMLFVFFVQHRHVLLQNVVWDSEN